MLGGNNNNNNNNIIINSTNQIVSPPSHCSNCNRLGHYFRECKEPITSYGIIAFRIKQSPSELEPAVLNQISDEFTINGLDGKTIEFLLIQRRDTLGYVEFMRGKYNFSNTDYIQSLFHQMTQAELERLENNDFELLWNSLWNNQISRQYRQEYENALAKYTHLQTGSEEAGGKTLESYIVGSNRDWIVPEWGFPKGRRGVRESEMTCAIREFTEETGLSESQVILVKNLMPLEETFLGGNRIEYRHRYYLAYCRQTTEVHIDSSNTIMNREIGDIGWFTYEKAMQQIRHYNIEKRQILSLANEILSNYIILPGREYLKLTSAPTSNESGNNRKVSPFQIVERDVRPASGYQNQQRQ
jgi:8-oxo-dGTP pyrophosphatase MutT (NUDIX family)